jgi:hypothetical protein
MLFRPAPVSFYFIGPSFPIAEFPSVPPSGKVLCQHQKHSPDPIDHPVLFGRSVYYSHIIYDLPENVRSGMDRVGLSSNLGIRIGK